MTEFKIGKPVAMNDVPVSAGPVMRRGAFNEVYERLGELKRDQALPIEFKDRKAALYARGALRKIAARKGDTLSSSRSNGPVHFLVLD